MLSHYSDFLFWQEFFLYRIILQNLGIEQRNDLQVLQLYLYVQVAGLPLIVNPSRHGHYSGNATDRDNEVTEHDDDDDPRAAALSSDDWKMCGGGRLGHRPSRTGRNLCRLT